MASAHPGPSRHLPRGRSALDADAVAAVRRERLRGAVIGLIDEQGYGATTVHDIAARAEVSTRDLYELSGGKQQLVLETCDAIVTAACGPLRARPPTGGDLGAGLAAVLDDVVDAVLSSPPAARLAVVDVVALGPAGVQRRRALIAGLHELLRDAVTREGRPLMSEAALAVLAGGVLQLVDRHLRSRQLRPLRKAALDLASWGATYETTKPRPLPPRDPSMAPLPASPILTETLPSGRHGLPAGFIRDHQRDRILEAVLLVSAEQGFEATPVKELIAAAGLTSKAFYTSFPTKEDAWTAAFEQAFSQLYLAGWRAARAAEQPDQIAAAIAACLDYLASEPRRARLLLVDAATAGRRAQPAIDEALDAGARLMARALAGAELPKAVAPAMTGGIAELAAGWILEGRAAQLPELRGPLIEVVLTPSLGVAAAARAAEEALRDPKDDGRGDDRRRLIDAFAEAVARDGLAATNLSDVAQAAGIELDVANALFTDELDCATKALDEWASQLVIVAAGAFLASAGDPPLAAHKALEAALGHIARTPAVAALAVSDDQQLATAAGTLRLRHIALFFQLIAGQVPPTQQLAPQPLVALELLLDGLLATLRRFAQQGRIPELPQELPALSLQALTPFFGADEARRVAEQSAAASTSR
ncbi:TetR/AcrR family transcriptional regulator [Baekduia sp.]|jgi:AcrR family transcriptional regulator|uniref:TetR/AcrR family transcriptional regulator n=1 Tax=Baekduia sp. TaxID=2600305 RepID=UPI002DFC99CC|nr:TetR/AcrR family transcriptional regulator [Baekduia sp.]